MNITKLELCNKVSKRLEERYEQEKAAEQGRSNHRPPHVSELKPILEFFLDEILNVLSERQKIEIRGFGAFRTKERKPRVGRNPRTGQAVDIPAFIAPIFKFSKDAQKIFNEKLKTAKP